MYISLDHITSKLTILIHSGCLLYLALSLYSAWIEDNNVYPYLDFKEQMVKLGKPKNSFDKAVVEIEAFMKNPAVRNRLNSLNFNIFNWIIIISG